MIVVLLLAGGGIANAQTLPLDTVLALVLKNNPELKVYDSKIAAYRSYADGARSYEPPQVGAGLFMTPYNASMWKGDAMTGSPGMGSFMVSAQQMFSNPQKLKANAGYMLSMASVDKEMKGAMGNELCAMAKMHYYEWIVLKKKRSVLKESTELLNYLLKSSEIRYTFGMDKLSSYYKAKAMLGDAQNMQLMTEFEIQQKRIALNTLMNRNKDQEFDIDTAYTLKGYDALAIDTAQLSANRSDLRALGQDLNLLKAKQNYERSRSKPDFGLKYDHMFAFGTQPQQFSIMGMISIPIAPWSSKMYRSAVTGLDLEMDVVEYRRQNLMNTASGTLHSLKAQIRIKKQQLELYDISIVPAMQRNYQTSLIAFEQNKEELFMVLDAWQNLKLAQLSRLDQLSALLLLQVGYEKELEIR